MSSPRGNPTMHGSVCTNYSVKSFVDNFTIWNHVVNACYIDKVRHANLTRAVLRSFDTPHNCHEVFGRWRMLMMYCTSQKKSYANIATREIRIILWWLCQSNLVGNQHSWIKIWYPRAPNPVTRNIVAIDLQERACRKDLSCNHQAMCEKKLLDLKWHECACYLCIVTTLSSSWMMFSIMAT